MTTLEEMKKQRRELDQKIKEMEKGNIIRCGNTRFEHRTYPTGKVEFIIAVCRQRELMSRSYSEWWGQVLNKKSKDELIEALKETILNLNDLLAKMQEDQ